MNFKIISSCLTLFLILFALSAFSLAPDDREMLSGHFGDCCPSGPGSGILLNDNEFQTTDILTGKKSSKSEWLDLRSEGEISKRIPPTDFYLKTSILRFTIRTPDSFMRSRNDLATFKFFLFDCTKFNDKSPPIFGQFEEWLLKIFSLEVLVTPLWRRYTAQLNFAGHVPLFRKSSIKLFGQSFTDTKIVSSRILQMTLMVTSIGTYKIYINGLTSSEDMGEFKWSGINGGTEYRACFVGLQYNQSTVGDVRHVFQLHNLFVSTEGTCQNELINDWEIRKEGTCPARNNLVGPPSGTPNYRKF